MDGLKVDQTTAEQNGRGLNVDRSGGGSNRVDQM